MLIFILVMTYVVRTRRRLLVLAVPDRPERDLTPVGPPVPRTSLASSFPSLTSRARIPEYRCTVDYRLARRLSARLGRLCVTSPVRT